MLETKRENGKSRCLITENTRETIKEVILVLVSIVEKVQLREQSFVQLVVLLNSQMEIGIKNPYNDMCLVFVLDTYYLSVVYL
jgi:hypothetical protein